MSGLYKVDNLRQSHGKYAITLHGDAWSSEALLNTDGCYVQDVIVYYFEYEIKSTVLTKHSV